MGHPSAIRIRYRRIQSELVAMRLITSYGDWRWFACRPEIIEHYEHRYFAVLGFKGTI